MSSSVPNGRIVEVHTTFHREGIKPGGVGRNQAMVAAKTAVQKAGSSIEKRLHEALGDLVTALADQPVSLRNSSTAVALLSCSNDVRDLAGLVERHLLTETAICLSDALDAVVYEGKRLDPAESLVYSNAVRFAHGDAAKGAATEAYAPLLNQLRDLTNHVIARVSSAAA